MLKPTRVEPLTELQSNGMLLALPAYIRLGFEVNGWGKHSSLLRYGINYGRKICLWYRPLFVCP
jgi:hypothetical protein